MYRSFDVLIILLFCLPIHAFAQYRNPVEARAPQVLTVRARNLPTLSMIFCRRELTPRGKMTINHVRLGYEPTSGIPTNAQTGKQNKIMDTKYLDKI
jgi:hypothetical protein